MFIHDHPQLCVVVYKWRNVCIFFRIDDFKLNLMPYQPGKEIKPERFKKPKCYHGSGQYSRSPSEHRRMTELDVLVTLCTSTDDMRSSCHITNGAQWE